MDVDIAGHSFGVYAGKVMSGTDCFDSELSSVPSWNLRTTVSKIFSDADKN